MLLGLSGQEIHFSACNNILMIFGLLIFYLNYFHENNLLIADVVVNDICQNFFDEFTYYFVTFLSCLFILIGLIPQDKSPTIFYEVMFDNNLLGTSGSEMNQSLTLFD